MIKTTFFETQAGQIVGFSTTSHGDPIVCAAVSALTLNTVNAIENFCKLTPADTTIEADLTNKGHLVFILKNAAQRDTGAGLLLDSLSFGLIDIQNQNPGQLNIDFTHITQSPYPHQFKGV